MQMGDQNGGGLGPRLVIHISLKKVFLSVAILSFELSVCTLRGGAWSGTVECVLVHQETLMSPDFCAVLCMNI